MRRNWRSAKPSKKRRARSLEAKRLQPPVEGPKPSDQVNLTDEELRVMPVAGGGFEQCYNAQALVAEESLLVWPPAWSRRPNDKQQVEPMLDKIAALAEPLGKVETLLGDNGFSARPM